MARTVLFRPSAGLLIPALLAAALWTPPARAATEVTNAAELRERMGLDAYGSPAGLDNVRIAVLDNGFAGYAPGRDQLPASAEVVEGPGNPQSPSSHGLGMAEIVWAMAGRAPRGPKFYLVNANGFTNFKAAIDFVARERVDIVLYSQVWPFGSNFDGKGFINEAVNRATRAGVIWINAAGNFGGLVHEGSPAAAASQDIAFENRVDENAVTVTLSWTDFRDSESHSTAKDLDLLVYDSRDRLVGSSELIQRGEAPPEKGESKLSSHARETVTLRALDRGRYRARVVARSTGFDATDRFRLLLETEKQGSLELPSRTAGAEILAPADNPNVLTVGERHEASSRGPTADGRAKPDALVDESIVRFSSGATVRGSSTAAAMVAGAVALMKAAHPALDPARLLAHARSAQLEAGSRDGLVAANPGAWPPLPPQVTGLVPAGGRLMIHPSGRFVVLTPVDPLELPQFRAGGAYRLRADDVLSLDPYNQRWMGTPAQQAASIAAPWVEFRPIVAQPGSWRAPAPQELARW